MIRESTIAVRGQVFYYNPVWGVYGKDKQPKTTYQNNGSLEFKTRPYLVISTDKGNFTSTTCNIIPITTRDNTVIPSQVKFVFNGRNQVILTEQITTCNLKDLGEYCYTVSEDVLDRVQKGMLIQFGMDFKAPEVAMDDLADKLESIVDRIIANAKRKSQSVTLDQNIIDNLAIKLGSAVEDLVGVPETPTITTPKVEQVSVPEVDTSNSASDKVIELETKVEESPKTTAQKITKTPHTPNYSGMSPIEKFNARYNRTKVAAPASAESKSSTNSEADTSKKPRKQPWDIDKQKQFLADCDVLTPDELMEKYEFKTKKDLYNHKYLIKNRIKELDK